jgi:peptidoglycan/xylan/chitin deacetylase (PgdA/CDA1 family)
LLPGPDIGRRGADIMRATRDAGFETAIHCWDHVKWQDGVEKASATWTEIQMRQAHERYVEVFGTEAPGHGAAGWQMNAHALRLTQRLGYRWASDCRGTHPFVPVWNAELVTCPQLPTTLPTLDELVGTDDLTPDNVHLHLLRLTAEAPQDHVFTLHAELEGLKFGDTLERLLTGWREQGYELVSLGKMRDALDPALLPRHEMVRGEIPGRAGLLMLQGEEFLSTWKEAA